MSKSSYLKFKNLSRFGNIIHGIFPKFYKNFSIEYDKEKQIVKNKKKLADILKINYHNIHSVYQVHGATVKIIKSLKFSYPEKKADGLLANKPNVFLLVKTADCFPVLLFDKKNQVVGIVHVGWRGAIEKIFLIALQKMFINFRTNPKDVIIGIGPGIGSCCFKHKNLIQTKLPEWKPYIKQLKNNLKSIDLVKFIKDKFVEAGVKPSNIEKIDICTNCDKRFYSHLRSFRTREKEGRFASLIGILNK